MISQAALRLSDVAGRNPTRAKNARVGHPGLPGPPAFRALVFVNIPSLLGVLEPTRLWNQPPRSLVTWNVAGEKAVHPPERMAALITASDPS
jgi:hypothetical protein